MRGLVSVWVSECVLVCVWGVGVGVGAWACEFSCARVAFHIQHATLIVICGPSGSATIFATIT